MRAAPLPDAQVVDPVTGWNVWGQTSAVRELQRAVRGAPAHAWLFAGPSRSGKRLAAIAFAMALCCASPPAPGYACGTCSVCRRIQRGVYPDVSVHGLASQSERDRDKSRNLTLNIGTVREVASAIAYRPGEARWRIVIVDDVETMQETAQEAFLKTLEEPPPYAIIILLAADADRLLETIRSRCTVIRFGVPAVSTIAGALQARGLPVAESVRIAGLANGSIGWAVQAAANPAMVDERAQVTGSAMRLVTATPYDRIVRAIHLADAYPGDREAVRDRLEAVQQVWRSALYASYGMGAPAILEPGESSTAWLDTVTPEAIVQALKSVETCVADLDSNVRPRLALETMVSSWPIVTA